VVATAGKSAAGCAAALADALETLAGNDGLLGQLGAGAAARARARRWPAVVAGLYDDVDRRLQRRQSAGMDLAIGQVPAQHA
jgi:hypothetical protein